MTMTAEELNTLRKQLAEAEVAYSQQRKATRQEVSEELARMTREIHDMVNKAQVLAESADLVFFYSPGYEGFCTETKEDWSESSIYC
jgi:hypothetical protein